MLCLPLCGNFRCEQLAGVRLGHQLVALQALTSRSREQRRQARPAKRRTGNLRSRKRDRLLKLTVRVIASDPRGAPLRAPQAPLSIDHRTIGIDARYTTIDERLRLARGQPCCSSSGWRQICWRAVSAK